MAIDFSLSELVALSLESFFYGTLPRCINFPHPVPTYHHFRPMRANAVVAFSGIYVVLFGSSIKVLLNKRKAISGTTPLLALAGVLVALITWVSISHPDTLLLGVGSH